MTTPCIRIHGNRTGAAIHAAQRIHAKNPIPVGVERLPGPDQSIPPSRSGILGAITPSRMMIGKTTMSNQDDRTVFATVFLIGDLWPRQQDAIFSAKGIRQM